MSSPLTLRLDPKTRRRIARIASSRQVSTSEVVRQAIAVYADRQEGIRFPYEAVADLIAAVRGGNPERSSQAGRGFATLLKKRRSRS
jgi:predicted transcriptional regulator